ncbi:MAG: SUF system NifU family Fe-S cluster assembly protein [Coxiellaceae bacterium]|nr:SUF system NifU family Fe-S cluster assembly protein [Coxiellaceae bacterium]
MSDVNELYRELIIDHGRRPRNFGESDSANHVKEGFNPLCGDKLTLYLLEEDGVIRDIKFNGVGCAISMASASMMSELLIGKTLVEAEQIFKAFHQLVTQGSTDINLENLGKLKVLAGVAEFPARVKCATLSWHTLMAAVNDSPETVSTE